MLINKAVLEILPALFESIFVVQQIATAGILCQLIADELDKRIVKEIEILRQVSEPGDKIETVIKFGQTHIHIVQLFLAVSDLQLIERVLVSIVDLMKAIKAIYDRKQQSDEE